MMCALTLQILLTSSILLLLCILINCDDGEFFTSVETMEELLDIEIDLIESLDHYIKDQQRILELLTSRYEQSIEALSEVWDREKYVSNPINAFSIIKRLTKEWPKTLSLIPNRSVILGENELPGKDDFLGAVKAIFRLQDVYQFNASTLAKGNLPGVDKHSIMTAEDCAEIAYYYYSIQFYELSTQWLLEALDKVDEDKSLQKGYILESLVLSTCFQGDQNSSTTYLEKLLTAYPSYSPPAELISDFNIALLRTCSEAAVERRKTRRASVPELFPEEIEEYNSICRRNVTKISQKLKCRYIHYNVAHLRFSPFKMEELNIEPPVVLFHNAIYNDEIKHLKNVSAPYMMRAQIIMPNGSTRAADYRTSRIAWVDDDEDEVSFKVSQRVKAMTNLDIEYAEVNQVSNYGMAGEYISHSDAIENINFTAEPTGNRIATFMFYMSEVPQGGHTVFPLLNISIAPLKGAGIFWFNLHQNGDVNYQMRHAACPVILGSKWVCNKWLHQAGQEFKIPCNSRNRSYKYFYL